MVLTARLRPAISKLNPDAPAESIDQAVEELARGRGMNAVPSDNSVQMTALRDWDRYR